MYKFDEFVESKDYIKSFRKDATSFLNEQEVAFLETLNDEEIKVMVEAWYNPADWARAGLRGVGNVARGVANIPSHIQAGYHGIDTTATGGVDTQAFKNQLASKQYGVDPNQYNTGKKGAFDQAAFDKGVQDAKVGQMDPAAAQQYYQQQQANLTSQKNVQTAQNDYEKAKQAGQPKPAAPKPASAKTIMTALGSVKGMTPKMAKDIAAALSGLGIK